MVTKKDCDIEDKEEESLKGLKEKKVKLQYKRNYQKTWLQFPSVYTDVRSYVKWIEGIMEDVLHPSAHSTPEQQYTSEPQDPKISEIDELENTKSGGSLPSLSLTLGLTLLIVSIIA